MAAARAANDVAKGRSEVLGGRNQAFDTQLTVDLEVSEETFCATRGTPARVL